MSFIVLFAHRHYGFNGFNIDLSMAKINNILEMTSFDGQFISKLLGDGLSWIMGSGTN